MEVTTMKSLKPRDWIRVQDCFRLQIRIELFKLFMTCWPLFLAMLVTYPMNFTLGNNYLFAGRSIHFFPLFFQYLWQWESSINISQWYFKSGIRELFLDSNFLLNVTGYDIFSNLKQLHACPCFLFLAASFDTNWHSKWIIYSFWCCVDSCWKM